VAETVTFDGGFSQGGNPIVSYEWDFGDGATATGMGVDHAYEAAGDYPVSLTVTDEEGLQDIDTLVISVEAPPTATPLPPTPEPPTPTPTITPTNTPVLTNTRVLTITPPQAVISSTLQAPVGQPVIFAGGQSQSSSPIVGYRWNLGDGTLAFGPTVVHTYTVARLYTVTLRITNTVGLTDTARQIIQINPPP
jgi:PKD repeat protein